MQKIKDLMKAYPVVSGVVVVAVMLLIATTAYNYWWG